QAICKIIFDNWWYMFYLHSHSCIYFWTKPATKYFGSVSILSRHLLVPFSFCICIAGIFDQNSLEKVQLCICAERHMDCLGCIVAVDRTSPIRNANCYVQW